MKEVRRQLESSLGTDKTLYDNKCNDAVALAGVSYGGGCMFSGFCLQRQGDKGNSAAAHVGLHVLVSVPNWGEVDANNRCG